MPPRLLLLALACLPLSACYVLESAQGQLELNARRVPIAKLLARPSTPPRLRAWLELATRIRDFASRDLGLPDNGSYRSYADVGRRYVVWNVFAAPEFSTAPKTWCFPIAGCVGYRGYFSEARTQRFARGLEARGFDVAIGGVAAYSTLGHFNDPVLNTMLDWDEAQLAALLFHELAHQRLYAKNDTEFNEAFATVVEDEGVRRWLAVQGQATALAAFQGREARYAEIAALMAGTRARLALLYVRPLPVAEKRALKAEELERLRSAFRDRRARIGSGYDWMFGAELNNAMLASVAEYQDCAPGLAALLESVGGDLPRFYAAAKALAKRPRSERHAAVCGAPVGAAPATP
jgi:predicted aminopeptidase